MIGNGIYKSLKRPSPLPSGSLSCLIDFSLSIYRYCSLGVREGHFGTAEMLGLHQTPSFHLTVKILFVLQHKCLQFLSFIILTITVELKPLCIIKTIDP